MIWRDEPNFHQHRRALGLRGMNWRYISALGLVALLSILAFTALRLAISSQETAAAEVNTSGRQRMLSQRLALYALRFHHSDAAQQPYYAQRITDLMQQMQSNHHDLIYGNPERNLPGSPRPSVAAIYHQGADSLTNLLNAYHQNLDLLITTHDDNPAVIHDILSNGTGPLLDRLDQVVNAYQALSESDVAKVANLEMLVLIATLTTLCLEAAFIFRPMVRRIVSERQALERAEGNTRTLIEHSHEGLILVNQHGQIEAINPSACRLIDRQRDEMLGTSVQQLLTEDLTTTERSKLPEELSHRANELYSITTEGRTRWLEILRSQFQDDLGQRTILSVHENTFILERYAEQLAEQNDTLQQFASVASHDLKAPLRAIHNLATWLQEDYNDKLDQLGRDHLQTMQQRVQRMNALIEGIYRFASTGGRKRHDEVIASRELIEQAHADCAGHQHYPLVLEGTFPNIIADHTLIWQVFTNLLSNAIKHHDHDHGTITITGKNGITGKSDNMSGGSASEETGWFCTICDDGPGIPKEHHELVFGMFQRLDVDREDSLGLGLALVRRIVLQYGGSIRLSSTPDQQRGSCFHLFWPLIAQEQTE